MSVRAYCVFCGSNPGRGEAYTAAAKALGAELGRRGIDLVYGGSKLGLMGTVADSAAAAGSRVTGVIPEFLSTPEVAHDGLDDLRVVASLHERKALMADLSDGFIALPGGLGTIEELCEIVTWAQLGAHAKPCGLLDVDGFYRHLRAHLDHAVGERFLRAEHRDMVIVERDPAKLLDRFEGYVAPRVEKWLDRGGT